jgi:hypothetical protein
MGHIGEILNANSIEKRNELAIELLIGKDEEKSSELTPEFLQKKIVEAAQILAEPEEETGPADPEEETTPTEPVGLSQEFIKRKFKPRQFICKT